MRVLSLAPEKWLIDLMTYCHTCSSIIKGYLFWGKPDSSLETTLLMTAAGKLGDDLGTQQRKHPTVHKNTVQVRASTPSCIQDEQLLLLSPCYHKHFRHVPETSGILCSSSTTHKTLCFIWTTGQVSTASPLAADSSWLLLHWLGHCKFLKQSFQVFYIQSWGQHGKNKVGSSSHSSGLHTVATSFGNLAPVIDAELSCKPGP